MYKFINRWLTPIICFIKHSRKLEYNGHDKIKCISSSISSIHNVQVLRFLLSLEYLPFSIARLCDDNLNLTIHFLQISGMGLHKYDCKEKLDIIYLYRKHFDELSKVASNSCLTISQSLCLITIIWSLHSEFCEY